MIYGYLQNVQYLSNEDAEDGIVRLIGSIYDDIFEKMGNGRNSSGKKTDK